MKAILLLTALLVSPSAASADQRDPSEASFAVYQACFDKAASELFATGITKSSKLEKAARKRCKAEREQAIIDMQVTFMLSAARAYTNRNDMIRAMDRVVAQPVMKRLGFEGY